MVMALPLVLRIALDPVYCPARSTTSSFALEALMAAWTLPIGSSGVNPEPVPEGETNRAVKFRIIILILQTGVGQGDGFGTKH